MTAEHLGLFCTLTEGGVSMQHGDRMAQELGDCRVTDQNGKSFALGDTWREKAAVLVFVRHFG
jgi:hypothetical protein